MSGLISRKCACGPCLWNASKQASSRGWCQSRRFWSGRGPRLCFQQARGRCSRGNHALSPQALGPRCVKSEDRRSLRPCWVRARHRPGCRAEPPLGLAQLGSRYRQPPSGSPQPRPEAARASAPSRQLSRRRPWGMGSCVGCSFGRMLRGCTLSPLSPKVSAEETHQPPN